jgi:hypothetical protein
MAIARRSQSRMKGRRVQRLDVRRFDEVLEHTEIALVLAAEIGDEALSADASWRAS